jgi:hypothetical protein
VFAVQWFDKRVGRKGTVVRTARKVILIALAAIVMFVATTFGTIASTAFAGTVKKGVSSANFTGVTTALGDVRAGWYYTWAADKQGIVAPSGTEFVPMIWGAKFVTDAQLNQAKALGSTLLAFNEPDMAGQAAMSPGQALDLWPRLESTNLRLGAPAVAFGGDQPGGWLDQFMSGASARGYRVDFIPLHWYGGDFSGAATGQLESYLKAVQDRYHKPIWLTEYALTNFSGKTPVYPSQAQQVDFVKKSAAMLQGLSYVERYAWFTLSTATAPTGLYSGSTPNESGVAYRAA